jgi:transposase-like protein
MGVHLAKLWRARIKAAELFPGGVQAYCLQEDLHTTSLYRWKRKFSEEKQEADGSSKFAPLVVSQKADLNFQSQRPMSELPDPRWVAEVLIYMTRGLS